METLLYDGSFAGWLSAVFEVYEYKLTGLVVRPAATAAQSLFGQTRTVVTDESKAERVWKGLQTRVSSRAAKQLYITFLSEEKGIEDQLLRYIQYAFSQKLTIENDYAHPAVQKVIDMEKKVRREKHRMEAFVRFQQTADNLWFAAVSPDFNVLPLIRRHFQERYADQPWLIYDMSRKYGIHYDGRITLPVEIDFAANNADPTNIARNPTSTNPADEAAATIPGGDADQTDCPPGVHNEPQNMLHPNEEQYRLLWQHYFNHVNIPARKNLRLHLRHMPTRYWKYLPEKQPGGKSLSQIPPVSPLNIAP